MAVLNILAAVLIALMPALEPCRLNGVFEHHHATTAEHIAHNAGPSDQNPCPDCPDCPKVCNHLSDAAGLPASALVSQILLAAPALLAECAPALLPDSVSRCSWFYEQPPPTGVMLVGTSNLRL